MKKFTLVLLALAALASPAFAAANPFMDVPMNHWAYDAIGQLAAHGILSGYPDGAYRGAQPVTRYEMASALARALAVVDMTKAGRQDVETLKKLVVEFRDELEALGVRVDDLDERVRVLEDRLGGWHIHGLLWLDVLHRDGADDDADPNGEVKTERARLWFERAFGENGELFFRARLDNTNSPDAWQQFYVTMPFFWDSTLTVGRFGWDMESAYYLGGDTALPATGGFAEFDSILTDRDLEAVGWSKQFGLGSVHAYAAHPVVPAGAYPYRVRRPDGDYVDVTGRGYEAWELFLMGRFQFTEQFGFDVGGQAFIGDNADNGTPGVAGDFGFGNLWTAFAGLRLNFNENVALRGAFYHQQMNGDVWDTRGTGEGWYDVEQDSANHWRLILDVDQELLKFTSVWLEYGQMDGGFSSLTDFNAQGSMFATTPRWTDGTGAPREIGNRIPQDMIYWRVALGQRWNEKWATHLFYFKYSFDRMDDITEWGLGVQYTYNPHVKFGLNFVNVDWIDQCGRNGDGVDDRVVRFRTEVTF